MWANIELVTGRSCRSPDGVGETLVVGLGFGGKPICLDDSAGRAREGDAGRLIVLGIGGIGVLAGRATGSRFSSIKGKRELTSVGEGGVGNTTVEPG